MKPALVLCIMLSFVVPSEAGGPRRRRGKANHQRDQLVLLSGIQDLSLAYSDVQVEHVLLGQLLVVKVLLDSVAGGLSMSLICWRL